MVVKGFVFCYYPRVPTPAESHIAYRGRLAPSPTGHLHLGHARTFWTAQTRAQAADGVLVLRNEDLDATRFKLEFVDAMLADLQWFGFQWREGPDVGGPLGPYSQSQRGAFYAAAFQQLREAGFIYPCFCSHKDIRLAISAPHADNEEPIYPGTCRPERRVAPSPASDPRLVPEPAAVSRGRGDEPSPPRRESMPVAGRQSRPPNWRFRVPDGEVIIFHDGRYGEQRFVAGKDFGDFVVWRYDNVPAYQLAVVVDDAAMKMTEVVRGADLLNSTARQLLLYRALGLTPPRFYHCPLMTDAAGVRLAKRHDALSLRALRAQGATPAALRQAWGEIQAR